MPLAQGGQVAPWAAAAVHDTVAAIARQAAYQRSLRDTLILRFLRWLGRVFDSIFDLFRGSVSGRSVTIALVVLLVLLVIARLVIAARAAREDRAAVETGARRFRGADSWQEAERLAAAGEFTDAAHALFAALLSALAARGEIRLHGSKTAGDYARDLRRRGSPSQRGFDAFRRRYGRVIYGMGECTAEEYEQLLSEARPLLFQERAA